MIGRFRKNKRLFKFYYLFMIPVIGVPESTVNKEKARILTKDEYLLKIQDHLESLAEIEHRRWCAFHFLRGWDVYPNPTAEKTKDEEMKLHGCLVSWQELDHVIEQVGENCKNYDRNSIIGLYDMWKELDYEIVVREDG